MHEESGRAIGLGRSGPAAQWPEIGYRTINVIKVPSEWGIWFSISGDDVTACHHSVPSDRFWHNPVALATGQPDRLLG